MSSSVTLFVDFERQVAILSGQFDVAAAIVEQYDLVWMDGDPIPVVQTFRRLLDVLLLSVAVRLGRYLRVYVLLIPLNYNVVRVAVRI